MKTYMVNYNTGLGAQSEEFTDLAAAKAAALEGMSFTGQAVTIHDQHGEKVTISEWCTVWPEEVKENEIMIQFGSAGYYKLWSDELENL